MSEKNITLLVVEADEHLRQGICDIFELDGYDVLMADNPLTALELTREHHPDLILSEVNFYPMNGHEFLKELRADPLIRATPFVFLTTRGEHYDLHKGLFLGADEFVIKPYDPEDLIIRIMMTLRKAELLKPASQLKKDKDNDVLFCYRTHDVKTIHQSIQYLSDAGLSVIRPHRRASWHNIEEVTLSQIKRSRCVVALISEGPTRYDIRRFWSSYELTVARFLEMPIFPVLIDGQEYGMPGALKKRVFTDARQGTNEALKQLTDQVQKYVLASRT
jgi:DNA-binding response OmpR family regulator